MRRVLAGAARVVVALVTGVAVLAGCGLGDGGDATGQPGSSMMSSGSEGTPGWWSDEAWGSMGSMMGGSWTAATSEPSYVAEMIAHHEEAVTAGRALSRSDRPQMRAFGASIVATQTAQIEQMKAWLKAWYPAEPTAADSRPMMRDLSGLSGDQLDRAFLEDMIVHHMVAVMMSQRLLWHGTEHEELAALARTIRDDQHAEILRMHGWLVQWFGVDGGVGPGAGWGPGMMGPSSF